MSRIKGVLSYLKHYGFASTVNLVYEKLFSEKKRFSPKKQRRVPPLPREYNKKEIAEAEVKGEKRILYTVHYFYPERSGGTERFTLNMAKEAKKRGNIPLVLVLDANLSEGKYTHRLGNMMYRYYEYDGIRCIGIRHKKAPGGIYYKNVILDDGDMRAFADYIINEEKIDLVHSTYPQPFASFLDEGMALGVPYTVTCTDFAMLCRYATMVDSGGDFCPGAMRGDRCRSVCANPLCRDFEKRCVSAEKILMGATYVTAPSAFVARILCEEFRGLKVAVIPHGISDSFAVSYRKRSKIRRFLYAGTLSYLKGVHLLVKAFSRLECQDAELVICGDGEEGYKRSLMRGADSRIRFIGSVQKEKMPEIYSSADCVIVPSMWYETYNFVAREAAITGAFLIVSDIGALPEALQSGGISFRAGDEDSLYEAMKRALEINPSDIQKSEWQSLDDEGDCYERIYNFSIKQKE